MPCLGIKVVNQQLALPNDLLGRCVVMLPLPALISGRKHKFNAKVALHVALGAKETGHLAVSVLQQRHVNPDAAMRALEYTTQRMSGGLSTRFKEARLKKKLLREEAEAKGLRVFTNQVVTGGASIDPKHLDYKSGTAHLDLEEMFREIGCGGGEGTTALHPAHVGAIYVDHGRGVVCWCRSHGHEGVCHCTCFAQLPQQVGLGQRRGPSARGQHSAAVATAAVCVQR